MALSTHWLGSQPSRFLTVQNHNLTVQQSTPGVTPRAPLTLFEKLELRIAICLRGTVLYFNDGLVPEVVSLDPVKSIKDHVFSAIQGFVEQDKLKDPQFIDLGFEKPLLQTTSNPKVVRVAVLLTVCNSKLTDTWVEANTGGYWKHHFASDEATAAFSFGHILGPAVLARYRQFDQAYIHTLMVGTPQQQTLAINLCRHTIELSLQSWYLQNKTRSAAGVVAYNSDQPQLGVSLMIMTSGKLSTLGNCREVTLQGQRYSVVTVFQGGQCGVMDPYVILSCDLSSRLFHRDGYQNISYVEAETAQFHKAPEFQDMLMEDRGDIMDTSPDGAGQANSSFL